jgi:ABC-2 type transport system permease protein
MNLRSIYWIFRKEMAIYLSTPLAYIIAAVFLALAGFMFYTIMLYFAQNYARMAMMGTENLDLTQEILRPFLGNLAFLFLLIVPLMSMRLLAEERRLGTIELLMTSPVRTVEIVLGKFLAGVAMNFLIYLLTIVFPLFLRLYGRPDWGPIVSGYLGVLLLLMAFVGLSMFASAITSSQLVAAAVSFGILIMLWIIGWISYAQAASGPLPQIVQYISIVDHLEDFYKGVIDSQHVVYFLSLALLGLSLTYLATESHRWRATS